MLRVGRRIYDKTGKYKDPFYSNFTPIIVLTKSTAYGSLGPYVLKDDGGRIMENIYQFSKCYREVPAVKLCYSRYDMTTTWDHPAETHIDSSGNLTPEYWNWRAKGMYNPFYVRYPPGCENMNKCQYALHQDENGYIIGPLDYIQSRKQIYLPIYCKLVKKESQFIELKKRLQDGENLLIIEVDGPHQESLDYYKSKYDVDDNFIENSTMLVNRKNIQIMLNDEKHAFGHGYCLAMALLDKDGEWNY